MRSIPRQVGRDELLWTGALSVALLGSFVFPLERAQRLPSFCIHYRLTGKHCIGCGTTRAFVALSHGRLAEALRLNALSPLVYLLSLAIVARGWLRILAVVRGR